MKKILFLVSALSGLVVFAQEREQSIENVEIKGRNKVKKERAEFVRHAQSVEILSEYDLNRNNPFFIEQTLGTMAGVQVDRRTQLGGQRVVIRGYGNDQKFNNWGIKSYLNGVPLTSADGITIFEDIDFSLINNIEVIKGPAATMYGGGVGGVLRLYMKPETEKGVSVSQKTTLGSFNLFQSATRVDAVGDNYAVMANYGHIESDGYRPRGNSLKNNYAFKGDFKLNPKQTLSVYASHNNSYEGVTGQISYEDYYAGKDPGNLAYAKKNAGNHFISNRISVAHHWNILPNFSNSTSIYFFNLDTKRIAAGAYEASQNPSYGIRSVFNLKNDLSEDFSNHIEAGVEYGVSKSLVSNYRFTNPDDSQPKLQVSNLAKKGSYFRYNNVQNSIFLIDRLTYKPWALTLLMGVSGNTLSYDREDLLSMPGLLPNYGKNLSFSKKFSTVLTPHIALQKNIKNQIFNISYSEGYNAPTAGIAFIGGINQTNDNLVPEKAKMLDVSVHGLLDKTRFDYQISWFNINVQNKLTQLSGVDPVSKTAYQYWSNTGQQKNQGFELSLGYKLSTEKGFIATVLPFINASKYDFKYTDFKTNVDKKLTDFSGKKVIGVPDYKMAFGVDVATRFGLYINNTFTYLGDVYTDFANTNKVKGFTQYNAKVGYKLSVKKWDFDAFIAGNNLTNQINYTFLFLGNNINDSDKNSNYPVDVTTDVSPGPSKAYYFGGINLKYHF